MQTSYIGLADCGCGACHACGPRSKGASFTLDTPYVRGAVNVLPVTKTLGYVMGISQMEKATTKESAGPLMTRATNVANLTTAMLLKFKPQVREQVLEQYGGMAWTQDVLKLAKNYPGGLGLSDAVRFSLALHFLMGIIEAEAKRDTPNARAYLAFARIFKDAVERRSGKYEGEVGESMRGLGSLGALGQYAAPADRGSVDLSKVQTGGCGWLGSDQPKPEKIKGLRIMFKRVFGRDANNSELQYWGQVRWCVDDKGKGATMEPLMVRVREALKAKQIQNTTPPIDKGPVGSADVRDRSGFSDFAESAARAPAQIQQAVSQAADAALDFLGKGAAFISDIICKGLKQVLGEAVGGVICEIIRFALNAVTAGLAAYVEIIRIAADTLINFIKLLTQGKVSDAFMEILRGMGQVLFMLSAPLTIPIFMAGNTKPLKDAIKDLKEKADRVTKKNPLFPLVLVMAIVQLVTSPPIPSPTAPIPPTIVNIVLALAPMVAVFIAPVLKPLIKGTLDVVEDGIEKFIKFALIIVQGFLTIKDIIPKVRAQLEALYKGQAKVAKPDPSKPQPNIFDKVTGTLDKFQKGFAAVDSAIKQFNFQKVGAAATTFLSLVPDILLAIMSPEEAAAVPSLTEWKDAAANATASVEEREQLMQKAALDLMNSISPEAAATLTAKKMTEDPKVTTQQRAKVAAQVVAVEFKNQSTFPTFAAAFRAELIKV
jgi:hypothetical protein